MALIKDYAICIRHQDYSESSQIVTLFGRQSGKIRALAKGSRRPRSKFEGGIDLLTAGEVLFSTGRSESSLATLTEFHLQESWAGLRGKLVALHCGQFMGDLMSQFTEDYDPHEDLFDIFVKALGDLQKGGQPVMILAVFELALLREVGMQPIWDRCCSCRGGLGEQQRMYFSSTSGGMLCRDCEGAIAEKRYVRPGVVSLVQQPEKMKTGRERDILEAHELLCYHIREILGKQNQMMAFVNQLLFMPLKGRQM